MRLTLSFMVLTISSQVLSASTLLVLILQSMGIKTKLLQRILFKPEKKQTPGIVAAPFASGRN